MITIKLEHLQRLFLHETYSFSKENKMKRPVDFKGSLANVQGVESHLITTYQYV